MRLADQVVLAFQPLPAEPAFAVLANELRAVHAGLEAVSNQSWDGLAETLRGISHRSALSHWALFIKAIAAFQAGDLERAKRFFSALPSGSVPAKASEAYQLLAGKAVWANNGRRPTEAVVDAVCRLTGQGAAGHFLSLADKLWREGQHADSYRILRDSIRQFPSGDLDWQGSLTDFYFSAPHTMAESTKAMYLDRFDYILGQGRHKNPIEEMLIYRLFGLLQANEGDDWGMRENWESFLRTREWMRKGNLRLSSLAYGWLGAQLAKPRPSPYFDDYQDKLQDAEGACGYLRRAVELDPTNLEAHLGLCAVYAALDRLSERNRLLDEMAERFPQEKRVLVAAALFCVERKAYSKGLDLLERAWRLDRLDPLIPELIVTARHRLARQQYERKRADKGREVLDAIQPFVIDKPDDFHRSRWTVLLRRGVPRATAWRAGRGTELAVPGARGQPFSGGFPVLRAPDLSVL